MKGKKDLKGLSLEELETLIASSGKERYRAKQLFRWMYRKGECAIDSMTDLSREFRKELADKCFISSLSPSSSVVSSDGTEKYLFDLHDGESIETVMIPEEKRRTVCVSTQAGCRMGCSFCATGEKGFHRNLSSAEIINQVCYMEKNLRERGSAISNIVFMGMGEPLDNLYALDRAIGILRSVFAFGISNKRITVSTCGLVPPLKALMAAWDVSIAISLNGTRDDVRERLMPVNSLHPISEILEVVRGAASRGKKRKITIEYVLIKEVNDTVDDARRLAGMLGGLGVKVNLIPINISGKSEYRAPERERIDRFRDILLEGGIRTITRERRGADIDAACGQLVGRARGSGKNDLDRRDTLT